MFGPYELFLCGGDETVGIVYRQEQEQLQGQPVVLQADSPVWYSTTEIGNGGPTELRVEPYKYTREHEGEVFATDEPLFGQRWHLLPANCGNDTFTIGADSDIKRVWTAEGTKKPIKIKEFVTGGANQVFKFVRLPE